MIQFFQKLYKSRLLRLTIFALLILFSSFGCATTEISHHGFTPQTITIENKLTVKLYNSLTELRSAYMFSGGDPAKIRKVTGFYSDQNNSIHCLKWDFYTCGHELFHVLQYRGESTLLVEKGFEHFQEKNYTSE